MDLSVIIVNYNKSQMLKDCLNSVVDMTTSVKTEIIVIDNASSDDSVKMVGENFPGITLIVNKENIGFSPANNQGAKIATGDYLLFLNNDTLMKNDKYFELLSFMKSSNAGICGLGLLNKDGSPQRQGSLLSKFVWARSNIVKTDTVIGAAIVISKEDFYSVGGWDEHYKFYNEDTDLCLSVRKKLKKNIYYYPECRIVHFGGVMSKYLSEFSIIEGYKGTIYFVRKHYGKISSFMYKPFILIDLLFKIVVCFLRLIYDKNKSAVLVMIKSYFDVLINLWRI